MFHLVVDIFHRIFNPGFADRKYPISILPMKLGEIGVHMGPGLLFYPGTAFPLDRRHDFGDRFGPGLRIEDMQMIGHHSNSQQDTPLIFQNTCYIAGDGIAHIGQKKYAPSFFGAKNQVQGYPRQ